MSVAHGELGRSGAELAALLKGIRRESGLSGARVAVRCAMSQSKISRIENGRVRPSLVDVEQIMRACGADSERLAEVMVLARRADTEWQSARGLRRRGLDRKQRELAGLEAASTEVRSLTISVIAGLLSVPEYIRGGLADRPGDHTLVVRRKLDRQRVLGDPAKRFTFLLTEQAVRWPLASPDVMARQIDHLASLTLLPNVRLGFLPIRAGRGPAPLNTFTVYDDRLATVELSAGVMVFRDPRDVAAHREEFDLLAARALFGADARSFLATCARAVR
ncbi:helix-turn-helix transcriptional regulator [Streptomyces sp. NPDC000594]|uniref:helix-turn-helix domain-containing protein n=1 Tax=Streptomyces sp. NPDC000594 TaxID=3154261 RepID=UPI00332624B2